MYRLVCAEQGQPRLLHETNAALTLIGRAAQAPVRLEAAGIAERHAVIERRASGYFICDLGSSAGVRVNQHPVAEQRLVSGDEIDLAGVRFRFEVVSAATQARAFDGLRVLAALAVAALIVGEIFMLVWMLAEPRSRHMRKEIGKSVRQVPPTTPTVAAPAGTSLAATAILDTNIAAPPAVLNRMLKLVRVEQSATAATVSLRFNVRAQVGERVLDPAAVRISVQWLTRNAAGVPQWQPPVWLSVPRDWENFSSKTLVARWEGDPQQLLGSLIRTWYQNRLQDQATQPPGLSALPPAGDLNG